MVDASPAGPSLDSVRRDLEQIDRAIVLLVAARLDAACTAIRCRSRQDGRIASPAQEARVLARARGWGKEFGLSPELTNTIFRAMVDAGKARFASGAGSSVSTTSSSVSRDRKARALARRVVTPLARTGIPAAV
jgi:chorismate mutase